MDDPRKDSSEARSTNPRPDGRSENQRPGGELLGDVYDELRRLARARMARERPGQTLQPTALVHEAWLRLGGDESRLWDHRGHFFAAAAESMRRILIERARRVGRLRHGGGQNRTTLGETLADGQVPASPGELAVEDLLALDQALSKLAERDAVMADVVRLRYWAGLTVAEIAGALELSERTVARQWTAARAWLLRELKI